jgi:assimilatory nitrate reductase catalytic subunit
MAYVCCCHGVNEHTVRAAIAAGAGTVEEVGMACRAGTKCGGCHPTIEAMIEVAVATRRLRHESAA